MSTESNKSLTVEGFDEQMSRLKDGWPGAKTFYSMTKSKLLFLILQDLGAGNVWFRTAVDKALESERSVPTPLWFRDRWNSGGAAKNKQAKYIVAYTVDNEPVYSDNPHIMEDTPHWIKPIRQKNVGVPV